MFQPINIPFGCVMLFNVIKLKEDASPGDVEWALSELCGSVIGEYGDDAGGFIAGQVFKYKGFVANAGSFDPARMADDHILIVSYWRSFEHHENSHADDLFRERFAVLCDYCEEIYEIGYEMLWQGAS